MPAIFVPKRISGRVRLLLEHAQAKVLDLVEFLLAKSERDAATHHMKEQQARPEEEREWNDFSLASALRGMDDEDGPTYTEDDLNERFS